MLPPTSSLVKTKSIFVPSLKHFAAKLTESPSPLNCFLINQSSKSRAQAVKYCVSSLITEGKISRDFRHVGLNFKDTGFYENVCQYTLSVENSLKHQSSNEKLRVWGDTVERIYTVVFLPPPSTPRAWHKPFKSAKSQIAFEKRCSVSDLSRHI